MIKSIFQDSSICYGVDYSHRPDIADVQEISDEQYRMETTPVEIEIIKPEIPEQEQEKEDENLPPVE